MVSASWIALFTKQPSLFNRVALKMSYIMHMWPPRPAHAKNIANGTCKCGSARCKTCAMVRDLQQIEFVNQPGHIEVIRVNLTCGSTSVVYLMACTACQAAYVGEAGCIHSRTLRERMSGHRGHPVADHFEKDNSVLVSMLTFTTEEVIQRRLVERAWIRRLFGEGTEPLEAH